MAIQHRTLFIVAALATLSAGGATAQQPDRSAERAARRAQQQVQQLQQQVTQAQAEKSKLEAERAAADKQLRSREQAARSAAAAQRAADEKLKAAEATNAELSARLAQLEKSLQDQRGAAEAALAAKDRELAQAALALQAKEAEREGWQQRFGQQARWVTECTDKNERLLQLSAELLNRWQGKGVFEALRQREPLLGLGDVQMFNLVQDYRDKADAQRFLPQTERR